MVGDCCAARLVSIIAMSIYFTRRPSDPWVADDRDWFAAHPDRAHRLRDAYPGEWPAKQATPHTIVKQRQPGVRQRLGITVMPELQELGEPPEEAVWAMFDLAFEAAKKGESAVLTEAIMTRYRPRRTGRQLLGEDRSFHRVDPVNSGCRSSSGRSTILRHLKRRGSSGRSAVASHTTHE